MKSIKKSKNWERGSNSVVPTRRSLIMQTKNEKQQRKTQEAYSPWRPKRVPAAAAAPELGRRRARRRLQSLERAAPESSSRGCRRAATSPPASAPPTWYRPSHWKTPYCTFVLSSRVLWGASIRAARWVLSPFFLAVICAGRVQGLRLRAQHGSPRSVDFRYDSMKNPPYISHFPLLVFFLLNLIVLGVLMFTVLKSMECFALGYKGLPSGLKF